MEAQANWQHKLRQRDAKAARQADEREHERRIRAQQGQEAEEWRRRRMQVRSWAPSSPSLAVFQIICLPLSRSINCKLSDDLVGGELLY